MEAPAEANPKFIPTNPHFFKPLLPDFHQALVIPLNFCKRYLNDHLKSKNCDTAVLRTVLGEWEVKIKNGRVEEEDGWRDFAQQYDLHVGDMVVFRYQGELVFDVMVFDPSACERSYYDHQSVPLDVKQESSLEVPTNDLPRSKDKVDNPVREALEEVEISSDPQAYPSFVSTVYLYNIKSSRISIPQQFAKSHGLSHRKCEMLIIDDHRSKSWPVKLTHKSNGEVIVNGCRDFIAEHGLQVGDTFSFELISRGAKPVMVFHALGSKTDTVAPSILKESMKLKSQASECLIVEKKPVKPPSQASHCFISTVTESSIKNSYLRIPNHFARLHGFKESCNMTVKDPNQRLWTVSLTRDKNQYQFRLLQGWKEVVLGNNIKPGQDIKLELVKVGELLMLNLAICGSKRDATAHLKVNKDAMRLKSQAPECLHVEKKPMKLPSMDSHFFISNVTKASLKHSYLIIPRHFARFHGLQEPCQMVVKDPNQRLWTVSLNYSKVLNRLRLSQGWKAVVLGNKIKPGQNIKLELVKGGELLMMNLTTVSGRSEGGRSGVSKSEQLVPLDFSD